jgi:hypothetical protein
MTNQGKISTGANDRSREAPIGQSAEGLPDDSGNIIAVDDAEVDAVRRKLGVDENANRGQQDGREALKRQVDEEIKASERGSE